MRTLKLTISYDGTCYVGWQRQASGTSIQGLLESILGDVDGAPVHLAGAGRTDAGVHALGQTASCTLSSTLDTETLRRALNARLPADVRVLEIADAPETFHARFSARSKTYRYIFARGPVVSPFAARYVWHVPAALDVDAMQAGATSLVGTRDFAAFQSTGTGVSHAVRTMAAASVTDMTGSPPEPLPPGAVPGGRLVVLEVTADGFLRHMVRAIAGTLADVGAGRRDPDLRALVSSGSRADAGPTAPAHGLWLVRVDY